jgi:hypothetical protein
MAELTKMTSETVAGDDDATSSDVPTGTEARRTDLTKPSRVFPMVLALALGLAGGYRLGLLAHPGGPGADTGAAHTHGAGVPGAGADVSGFSVSAGGYTVVPVSTTLTAGSSSPLRFRVRGPDGSTVTRFATVHEKQLHLIVARRDLSGYQHLHPTLGGDGEWSTPVTLPAAGSWRAIADFSAIAANGTQVAHTLGWDLTVPGESSPVPLPAPGRDAAVDGYTVLYEGTPQLAATAPLTFRVYRDGSPVTALERYLGSYGHLVVLREGDLGYVHVHADPPSSAGSMRFWFTPPSPGRYRMYFDFQVGGRVHTAEFTLEVP